MNPIMKIKKTVISLLAAAITTLSAAPSLSAQEQGELVTMLMVNLHNGQVDRYRLPDTPVVTFKDDRLVVTSDVTCNEYPRSDVSHFEIKKDWYSGIETPACADNETFTLTFTDNASVTVSAPALSRVEIFTLGGVNVASATATGSVATINVSHLSPGVYLVSPDCHPAIKIIKR